MPGDDGPETYYSWPDLRVVGAPVTPFGDQPKHWADALRGRLAKDHPLSGWAASIPLFFRERICVLPAWQVETLQLCSWAPRRTRQLIEAGHLALVVLVARRWYSSSDPAPCAAAVLTRRIRGIVQWLDLPGCRDTAYGAGFIVRLLRHFPLQLCHPGPLDDFLVALGRRRVRRTLAHVLPRLANRELTAGAVACVALPDELLSPHLVLAAGIEPQIPRLVVHWTRLMRAASLPIPRQRTYPITASGWFDAIAALRRRMLVDDQLPLDGWAYGPPPPTGFERIRSVSDTLRVGTVCGNCLRIYAGDLADGERAAYWRPSDHTVCIVVWNGDGFELEQVVGRHNSLVEPP